MLLNIYLQYRVGLTLYGSGFFPPKPIFSFGVLSFTHLSVSASHRDKIISDFDCRKNQLPTRNLRGAWSKIPMFLITDIKI